MCWPPAIMEKCQNGNEPRWNRVRRRKGPSRFNSCLLRHVLEGDDHLSTFHEYTERWQNGYCTTLLTSRVRKEVMEVRVLFAPPLYGCVPEWSEPGLNPGADPEMGQGFDSSRIRQFT